MEYSTGGTSPSGESSKELWARLARGASVETPAPHAGGPPPSPPTTPPPPAWAPPPGAPPPPAWGPPGGAGWRPPAPPSAARPATGRRRAWALAVVAVIVSIALVGAAAQLVNNLTHPEHEVGLTTPVTAQRGKVVFSDDFSDPGSGWNTKPQGASTFQYGPGGFTANAPGDFIYHRNAPYTEPFTQIGTSMTATIAPGAPQGANFGPACTQGATDSDNFHYEFLLTTDSRWKILRHQGVSTNPTEVLKEGTAPVAAGSDPNTVVGMCATQSDGHTTRLVMFVDGTQVADITDSQSLPGNGWVGDMSFGGEPGPTTVVTASQFSVRDITH